MSGPICVIPARMAASRFPGKPLKPLLGLALVLHVYERCRLSRSLGRVVVATCDAEIFRACEARGAETVMTGDYHPGAIDRTLEAVEKAAPGTGDDEFVLMVQGDEVLVTPEMLDDVIAVWCESRAPVVNLASRLHRTEDHDDPNCVKVVANLSSNAMMFSRAPIPSRARTANVPMYQQTGVIGFKASFLRTFGRLPRTPLEMAEGIDMLRTLEHGHPVRMTFTERETIGVDTPADRDRAEAALRADPVTLRYLEWAA